MKLKISRIDQADELNRRVQLALLAAEELMHIDRYCTAQDALDKATHRDEKVYSRCIRAIERHTELSIVELARQEALIVLAIINAAIPRRECDI
jgi:hypothetical protein